jgi:hypothetical protein
MLYEKHSLYVNEFPKINMVNKGNQFQSGITVTGSC